MRTQIGPDLSERQIDELISRMTVDEKIDQMLLTRDLDVFLKQVEQGENPAICGFAFMPSDVSAETINKVQHYVIEHSRFGIPMLIMGEGLHGVMNSRGTIFPQSIGMACSFNEELMQQIAQVIGSEAHAVGMRQVYAPNLDLAREPRWGRTEETFGEDPYLAARMGVSYVKGVQSSGVAATLKHYVAHGSPESGLNLSPVHLGERELREVMLEPFASCIQEADAMSVMPAYSEIDGIPVHASKFLMRRVLREELGFRGTVVSDYDGITMFTYLHHIADNAFDCAKIAIEAGIDIEAPTPFAYNARFRDAVKSGEIDVCLIDTAVKHILTVKSKLHLFFDPFLDEKEFSGLDAGYSKRLARKAAEESIVLLKNNGVLPLKKSGKIAIVGVNADFPQTGDYSYRNSQEKSVSLLSAIRNELAGGSVEYVKGCNISVCDEGEILAAEAAAERADAVIVVLGDNSSFFGGIGWGDADGNHAVTCGEGYDVNELHLPPAQQKLFHAVSRAGKPIILVLYTGRPYAIGDLVAQSDAVIQAWYPGEEGGNALSDILFGNISPSGKLSVSFPRSTGHLPCFYNYKSSARGANYKNPGTYDSPGRDYVFDNPDALFPFGFGLSYTEFVYSDLSIEQREDSVKVSLTVKNNGTFDAKENILLFLSQSTCPVTPAVKKLRAFQGVYLKQGESARVEFVLTEKDFTYIDFDMKENVCHTRYRISIGNIGAEFDW